MFVAFDVEDDIAGVHDTYPWTSDAIEFYWDTRPVEKRDGNHGTGTGQVILVVPKKGSQAEPYWHLGKRKIPVIFDIAFKKTQKGYRCELQLLLKELGFDKKPESGDFIHLEVMIDDCDIVDGVTRPCHMATSGKSYSNIKTCYYPTSFFVGD